MRNEHPVPSGVVTMGRVTHGTATEVRLLSVSAHPWVCRLFSLAHAQPARGSGVDPSGTDPIRPELLTQNIDLQCRFSVISVVFDVMADRDPGDFVRIVKG
jgi:hypothetical protein